MQKVDKLFETEENTALIAICTHKMIRNLGVWTLLIGILNTVSGAALIQEHILNSILTVIGLAMITVGIFAIKKTSLGSLLAATILMITILVWDIGIAIYNSQQMILEGEDAWTQLDLGFVFLIFTCVVFLNYCIKLRYLKEQIASVSSEKLKSTTKVCKTLLKTKLKNEPSILQTTDGKCRVQLLDGKAFFVQRNLFRAFIACKEEVGLAVSKPTAKSLSLSFNHPVSKLKYRFDRKNSAKLKEWFVANMQQPENL